MGFWESFIYMSLISILRHTVKNPGKKDALRGHLLNLRDIINSMYLEDEGFGISGGLQQ